MENLDLDAGHIDYASLVMTTDDAINSLQNSVDNDVHDCHVHRVTITDHGPATFAGDLNAEE